MDKEALIISNMQNSFIGDDGAIVGDLIYSKDLFVEDVHFKREWMNLKQIATKAMLVNISDAIAMNAKPKYALIGAVLPKDITKKDILGITTAFKRVARQFGITIIGGDTVSGDKIMLSLTIISKRRKHTLLRSGLKKGDLLAFTGSLGSVGEDLDTLLSGKKVDENSKFYKPILREEFIKRATKYLRCGLDISDGLSKDLSRLCLMSNLGIEFFEELDDRVLCSGEEYEMLFAFDEKSKSRIMKIARETKTKINIFARAISGSYKSQCQENHF